MIDEVTSNLIEENHKLHLEAKFLFDIVRNTPLIMKTFAENIKLQYINQLHNEDDERSISNVLKRNNTIYNMASKKIEVIYFI
jgi:hypothetical protein